MKVTYQPAGGDDDITQAYGHVFEAGQAVDVTDERALAKIKRHPSFRVAGEKPPAVMAESDDDKRLTKALDGRTKAAREAAAKAAEARAEADARERARVQAEAIAKARRGDEEA